MLGGSTHVAPRASGAAPGTRGPGKFRAPRAHLRAVRASDVCGPRCRGLVGWPVAAAPSPRTRGSGAGASGRHWARWLRAVVRSGSRSPVPGAAVGGSARPSANGMRPGSPPPRPGVRRFRHRREQRSQLGTAGPGQEEKPRPSGNFEDAASRPGPPAHRAARRASSYDPGPRDCAARAERPPGTRRLTAVGSTRVCARVCTRAPPSSRGGSAGSLALAQSAVGASLGASPRASGSETPRWSP